MKCLLNVNNLTLFLGISSKEVSEFEKTHDSEYDENSPTCPSLHFF